MNNNLKMFILMLLIPCVSKVYGQSLLSNKKGQFDL